MSISRNVESPLKIRKPTIGGKVLHRFLSGVPSPVPMKLKYAKKLKGVK